MCSRAAHRGPSSLAFSRRMRAAAGRTADVVGCAAPVRSDSIAVTTSSASGNQLDYYLDRTVDTVIALQPNTNPSSQANASLA